MTPRVVHLELHTGDLRNARAFYGKLLNWRPRPVTVAEYSYLTMSPGGDLAAGIVECRVRQPVWLPYVEVDDVYATTDHARRLGAMVLLGPREGPAGWRSVVSLSGAGEIALWQRRKTNERHR